MFKNSKQFFFALSFPGVAYQRHSSMSLCCICGRCSWLRVGRMGRLLFPLLPLYSVDSSSCIPFTFVSSYNIAPPQFWS